MAKALPDPAPVSADLQRLLLSRTVYCSRGGLDPMTGLGCYGLVHWSFAQIGIALPPTAEEGVEAFVLVQRPYQAWDVVLAQFGTSLDARHVGLLLTPPCGFHCSWATQGLAHFSLVKGNWQRAFRHVWRYHEFCH